MKIHAEIEPPRFGVAALLDCEHCFSVTQATSIPAAAALAGRACKKCGKDSAGNQRQPPAPDPVSEWKKPEIAPAETLFPI